MSELHNKLGQMPAEAQGSWEVRHSGNAESRGSALPRLGTYLESVIGAGVLYYISLYYIILCYYIVLFCIILY